MSHTMIARLFSMPAWRVGLGAAALAPSLVLAASLGAHGAPSPPETTSGPISSVAHSESAASPDAPSSVPTGTGSDEPARATWQNGLPSDPSFFPIGVWLQAAGRARDYKEIGINHYIGQWQGPTVEQLAALADADMPVMATQNDVGLAHLDDPIIVGWTQQDEPDNAQWNGSSYDPCVEPSVIVDRYERMKAADPTRPVWLNLGQGVAHPLDRPYVGRGSACARRWDQYPHYVQGADIVSFDIYPVTSPYDHIRDDLSRVALGVDRLVEWTGGEKPVWNVIETTHINSDAMPTPHQTRAEVWMSIVHGSRGIVYFAHEWEPRFREAGLLHYPEMRAAVADVNRQISSLAAVINGPPSAARVEVTTSPADVPVDTLVKQHDGSTYVFAVSMRDERADVALTLSGVGLASSAEVVGEDRSVPVIGGVLHDEFSGHDVHIYRVRSRLPLAIPWLWR